MNERPNVLQSFLVVRQLDECKMMNELQSHGIVSDECATAADVCPSDCWKAVEFLRAAYRETKRR